MELLIESASSFAADIDNLIMTIAVITGFWLILAEGILIYFCLKYRKKEQPKGCLYYR